MLMFKRWSKITRHAVAWMLACVPLWGWAVDCPTGNTLLTMPSIKIAADAPVGATLWSQQNISFSVTCTTWLLSGDDDLYLRRRDLTMSAYGLAFLLTYKGNQGSGAASIATGVHASNGTTLTGTVNLELRKTGTTPSTGTVSLADRVAFTVDGSSDNSQGTFFIRSLSNISFLNYTCDIDTSSQNITVPLGEVRIDRFSGIGSTSTDHAFNIGLTCTQPTGTYNVALTFNGTADSSGATGVLALTSSADAATGVGIQMLMNGSPVALGTALEAGSATAGATLSIPMTARYYQTASTITPGSANGIATFTVSYK